MNLSMYLGFSFLTELIGEVFFLTGDFDFEYFGVDSFDFCFPFDRLSSSSRASFYIRLLRPNKFYNSFLTQVIYFF